MNIISQFNTHLNTRAVNKQLGVTNKQPAQA